jgi:hypothetical protein
VDGNDSVSTDTKEGGDPMHNAHYKPQTTDPDHAIVRFKVKPFGDDVNRQTAFDWCMIGRHYGG